MYPAKLYSECNHRAVLSEMAREILVDRPGITNRALAFEIARRHGISRTSKKQVEYLEMIIEKWAGVWQDNFHSPVYWVAPEHVERVMKWRGLSPFGYDRDWREIAYPELLGLTLEAVSRRPDDPVDYICNVFELRRRHFSTFQEFQTWVDN